MMKQNRHSLMAKGIMVLLSLLVLIFAFTYSWFSVAPEVVTASGISANAIAGVNFEVAIGFESADTGYNYLVSKFGTSADLTRLVVDSEDGVERTYNLLANYSPKDVTGNGRDLYVPLLEDDPLTGERTVVANTTSYTEVTPNREYISFDMLFKCEQECRVFIDNGSFVRAACETEPGDGHLTNNVSDDNKSTYGNFSKDAVVGAMRVSFVDYNETMDLSNIMTNINDTSHLNPDANFIWLPRPDIYLQTTKNTNDWVLHTAYDESDFYTTGYGAQQNTSVHTYYDVNSHSEVNYTNTVTECNTNVIVPVNLHHVPTDGDPDTEDYWLGKCRVNIWVEGMDAEARRAIAGGQFYINFDLRAG